MKMYRQSQIQKLNLKLKDNWRYLKQNIFKLCKQLLKVFFNHDIKIIFNQILKFFKITRTKKTRVPKLNANNFLDKRKFKNL